MWRGNKQQSCNPLTLWNMFVNTQLHILGGPGERSAGECDNNRDKCLVKPVKLYSDPLEVYKTTFADLECKQKIALISASVVLHHMTRNGHLH